MFKRFSVAEDISTQTALKSSVQRAIKKSIVEQYPPVEDHIDDVIQKKAEVLEAKGKDRLMFVVADGMPLFFRIRDGPFFPTLRVLHQYPLMMPRIQVDTGAIKFVLGGANVMCPGINGIPVELPEGAPVAVYAEGKQHAIAIGTLAMSTADIRAKGKGIGVEILHHLDDQLWHVATFAA